MQISDNSSNRYFKLTLQGLFSIVFILLISLGGTVSQPAFSQENEFPGERVVHLLQEPRHRTVHQDGQLYLLDVQINPGDTSFPHTHDQAILLTSISRGDGLRDGPVSANIDYASQAFTHKVSNEGPGLFRIIAMVNAGAGNNGERSDRPVGLAMEPQLENPWFRSYRVDLAPGEQLAVQEHQVSSVVVQVSDGLLHVTRGDGVTQELDQRADWAWHKPGTAYIVTNAGTAPASFVINEGR